MNCSLFAARKFGGQVIRLATGRLRMGIDMNDFKVIEKCSDSVYILEYTGNDEKCIIPEMLMGKTVTGLEAFSFSEKRQLREVVLPHSVKYIGAHTFYNCRALKKITVGDEITDIGDGAFKNCYNISELDMTKKASHIKCLKGILSEVNNEMTVTLHYNSETAKLVFPYYLYNYEENTPARIVNQITEGSGVRYRECIDSADVNFAEYDRIFESAMHIDVQDSAWKIASCRLKYPYKLSDSAKNMYREFLENNKFDLVRQLIKDEYYEELDELLKLEIMDNDDLKQCAVWAGENSYMEGLSILLQYQKEKYGTVRKKYEF